MIFTYTEYTKHPPHSCNNVDICSSLTHKSICVANVIFTCSAPDILSADSEFEKALGKNPAKLFTVGCSNTP